MVKDPLFGKQLHVSGELSKQGKQVLTFIVSDGTPNYQAGGSFTIDVTPTNDRPTASGSASAQVTEGNNNAVRLGAAHLGMGDIAEQMALANHLVQTMRAQGFGQRRGGRLGK